MSQGPETTSQAATVMSGGLGAAIPLAKARRAPIPAGQRSAPLFRHGTLLLRFYQPQGVDEQTPHGQDEIYVIASGEGTLVVGNERTPVNAGDALFVAADAEHRFEDFTDDFAAWVMFYGPDGGERAH